MYSPLLLVPMHPLASLLKTPRPLCGRALPRPGTAGCPGLITSERNAYPPQGSGGRGRVWRERFALRSAFRRADAVTANARSVALEIPSRFGVNAAKVHYIPNGIDLSTWDQLQQAPCPLALVQDPRCVNVGVIGRLVPQKNHLLFLRALARGQADTRRQAQKAVGEATKAEGGVLK